MAPPVSPSACPLLANDSLYFTLQKARKTLRPLPVKSEELGPGGEKRWQSRLAPSRCGEELVPRQTCQGNYKALTRLHVVTAHSSLKVRESKKFGARQNFHGVWFLWGLGWRSWGFLQPVCSYVEFSLNLSTLYNYLSQSGWGAMTDVVSEERDLLRLISKAVFASIAKMSTDSCWWT